MAVIGAKDEGSERYIRGLTVGVAICDEISLMPWSFFQMLLSHMSPEGARLYATTNPDSPYHWLKADYLDNRSRHNNLTIKRPSWTVFEKSDEKVGEIETASNGEGHKKDTAHLGRKCPDSRWILFACDIAVKVVLAARGASSGFPASRAT
jgi:hypothetical protein